MIPPSEPRLRAVGPDLWIADQPLRFLGLALGARMTVAKLADERLVLHSPIERTPALAAEVARIGTPSALIAPNRFHHLYVADWQAAHPDADLLVARGLVGKRPDLQPTHVLGEPPSPAASPAGERPTAVDALARAGLEPVHLEGFPLVDEIVFFHRPSAALIVSDLVFHVGREAPPLTRLAFRAMGAFGRPSVTPLERWLIRDRAAFRRSLERVLAWPFTRIVPAHGGLVERDAKDALRAAYRWLW